MKPEEPDTKSNINCVSVYSANKHFIFLKSVNDI